MQTQAKQVQKDFLSERKIRVSRVLTDLSHLHEKALQEDVLSKKVKELIALAISVSMNDETSIAYHLHNALEAGASHEEVLESLEVAIVTLGEPTTLHATQILRALDTDEEMA